MFGSELHYKTCTTIFVSLLYFQQRSFLFFQTHFFCSDQHIFIMFSKHTLQRLSFISIQNHTTLIFKSSLKLTESEHLCSYSCSLRQVVLKEITLIVQTFCKTVEVGCNQSTASEQWHKYHVDH